MKLKFNRVMSPRPKGSANTLNYYRFDPSARFHAGEMISADIRLYRMWWWFLRLAIELEESKIPINNEIVRLNRRYYQKWSLNTILTSTFDDWWRRHRLLFVEPPVERIKQLETLDSQYLFLKIPKAKTESDAMREIKCLLKNQLHRRTSEHELSGRIVPYIRLHIQYNCLVMSINGKSRIEIREWCNERYSHIVGVIQNKKDVHGVSIEEVFSYEQSVSRVLSKARSALLSTAQGIFP